MNNLEEEFDGFLFILSEKRGFHIIPNQSRLLGITGLPARL
jgi:hypothetical protein